MTTISLCMIAKNEEQLIKNALDSVKPFVDEMIVIDTGSDDNTRQISQECGATVYDFKWENDFSKAKNFAKSMAKGQWILFLDADECMSAADLKDMKKVLSTLKEQEKPGQEIVAFSFVSRHYTKEKSKYADWKKLTAEEKQALTKEFSLFAELNGYYDVLFITRLFKNKPQIYFKGHVHEDINPSIIEWNAKEPLKTIVQVSMPIHHLHFLKSQEYVAEKQKLYFEMSKEKVKHGKDPKTCLDLAVGYVLFEDNFEKSFYCIADAVFLQGNVDSEKKALIKELVAKNKQLRALHELMQLLDFEQHDINSIFNLAKAFYQKKAHRAAIVIIKKLFEHAPGEIQYIEYLGVCYDQIKYVDDAIKVFEHGVIVHPEHAQFYFNLGALYEKQKEWRKAIASFERAVQYNHPIKEQLKQRIAMLKNMIAGNHVKYTVHVGDVSTE
ncbi:glycosyltransferase [Candidatus Woesearchaeota archaeon]|nr:glycosyltransferase [Candidatus Woesearchaeota archaeon]